MKFLFLLPIFGLVAGCVGTPTKPVKTATPMFVEATSSFKWYSAHRKGEVFEYLEDENGNKFVMTYDLRSHSVLLPLMVVPANREFGMMLDDNLCTNGLAVERGANSQTYAVNITASWDKNIRETPPTGLCFARVGA